MKRKIIVLFEFIFIIIAIGIIIFVGNKLNKNNLTTENNLVLATISGNAILIDTDQGFSSPKKLTENSTIYLEPGTYYFKESGFLTRFKNKIKNFTITNRVVLDLIENNVSLKIINVGDVPINLTEDNVSYEILGIGEETEIKENESVEARQK